MYYSIYVNERMVLDNLDKYKIPNKLLKRLLYKDAETTVDEKLEIYFEHRRYDGEDSVIHHPALNTAYVWDWESHMEKRICDLFQRYKELRWMQQDFFEDEDTYEDEDGCLQNPYCCYVDVKINPYFEQFLDISPREMEWKLDENRRQEFEEGTNRARRKGWHLREVNEVRIYKSDIERIEAARKNHNLNAIESEVLFGMVFVTRMYGWRYCRMNTKNRMRGFKACFNRHVSDDVIANVAKTGLFKKVGDGRDWYNYDEREGWYNFKYDYKYLHFDVKEDDEVAYVFKTTHENNKLNLSDVYKEAMPKHDKKFCAECGEPFEPKSNRAKYCPDCKVEITKEQHRQAQQRYKERKSI